MVKNMKNIMRLRQICLIARDLEASLGQLTALLDVPVCYRDPNIIQFGLANGLMMLGGDFLEVVAPVEPNTAGGRFLERQGEGGYMVILQCEDARGPRQHITQLGVRPVWQVDGGEARENVIATHFHPRDVGGAILSIDSMGGKNWREPFSRWVWAGEAWADLPNKNHNKNHIGHFAAAEMSAANPAELAKHWSQLLDLPAYEKDKMMMIDLDQAHLRFVPSNKSRPDGLTGIDLTASPQGREQFYRRAAELGLPQSGDDVHLSNMKLRVV